MVLVVLFILWVAIKWFFKFWGFLIGAVCTLMGIAGVAGIIYILATHQKSDELAIAIILTIFCLSFGIFCLYLVFKKIHKKIQEDPKEKSYDPNATYEVHFSEDFETWMKDHLENEKGVENT